MKKLLVFAAVLLIVLPSCSPKMTIIKATQAVPEIVYDGRFEFTPDGAKFDWPLSSITASFEGNSVKIDMSANGNEFNIYTDGAFRGITSDFPYYIEFKDSGINTHTVRVEKRSEIWGNPAMFTGISIPETGRLLAPEAKKHKMLVIGDSISVGYGNEGPGLNCDNVKKYTNPGLAYAALAARTLDASIHLIAVSGRGLIRNYAEPLTRSAEPMPVLYERTLANDPSSKWDISRYAPDIVVINLGTNDFSTEPKPEQEVFTKELDKFIRLVRTQYPDSQIFVICGPMPTPPQCTAVQDAVEKAMNRKDKKVHYVALPRNPMEDLGCDWHPNLAADRLMADILTDEIIRQLDKAQ